MQSLLNHHALQLDPTRNNSGTPMKDAIETAIQTYKSAAASNIDPPTADHADGAGPSASVWPRHGAINALTDAFDVGYINYNKGKGKGK